MSEGLGASCPGAFVSFAPFRFTQDAAQDCSPWLHECREQLGPSGSICVSEPKEAAMDTANVSSSLSVNLAAVATALMNAIIAAALGVAAFTLIAG